MVKIKLTQIGKRNARQYRVVAVEAKKRRDGRVLEILGLYDPHTKPVTLKIDRAKVEAWLKKGAQPTETVRQLISKKD